MRGVGQKTPYYKRLGPFAKLAISSLSERGIGAR
jgi:hypothetical protein